MMKFFMIVAVAGLAFAANAGENLVATQEIEAGNLKALNQAFKQHTKTDGGDAEEISIAIGKSILSNPKNFLLALKKNKKQVASLGAILGNLGPDFVDDFKKQKTELEKRFSAIHSVKTASLKSERTECEAELKRQIERTTGK